MGDTEVQRLRDNIREELGAQNALLGLGIGDAVLDQVADALAVNIDYAFSVTWSPRWDGTRSEGPAE